MQGESTGTSTDSSRKQPSYIGQLMDSSKSMNGCIFFVGPLEQHRTGIVQKSRNRTRQHWYVHEISWLFNVIVQVLNIHWNGAMEMIVTVVNGCEKQM